MLKRYAHYAEVADVSPCVAVEDLPQPEPIKANVQCTENTSFSSTPRSSEEIKSALYSLNIHDINLGVL